MWNNNFSKRKKNLTNWKLLPFQWRVIELRKEKEALNFIREEMLRQSCCLLTCLSMTRVLKQHRSLNEAFHRDGMSDVRQSNLPTCLILNSGVTPSVPDRIVLFGRLTPCHPSYLDGVLQERRGFADEIEDTLKWGGYAGLSRWATKSNVFSQVGSEKEAREKTEEEVKDLNCELKDQELAWSLKCGTGTCNTEGAGGQHGPWYTDGFPRSYGLLPEVKRTTPFGRGDLVAQIPEEGWLFSTCLKSSYSAGWAHFWIFGLPET